MYAKRWMKGIVLWILVTLGCLFTGCGEDKTDYSDYFSITKVAPIEHLTDNQIEVDYEIDNLGKKEDRVFCVTINGTTKEYSVGAKSKKSDKIVIDIGRPDDYQLSYTALYEVKKDGDVIWSKEDSIDFDSSDLFLHKATVKYGDETAEIELVDYQVNYFDLSELFPSFDASGAHNVELMNDGADLAKIQEKRDPNEGTDSAAYGSILRLVTAGDKELCDTYHFSDGLEAIITDATPASSINWEEYMTFTNEAQTSTSTVVGIDVRTVTLNVIVENPSDETIYGTVTNFYVNEIPVSEEYFTGTSSDHLMIKAGETDKLHHVTSGPVWKITVGDTPVSKFGLEVKLEDSDGNVLYEGIQWLYLEE